MDIHHCRSRTTGGRPLVDQPLMGRVLADLALDVTAATALAFRVALAFDRASDDPVEAAFARVMTPVAKYWIAKAAPAEKAELSRQMGTLKQELQSLDDRKAEYDAKLRDILLTVPQIPDAEAPTGATASEAEVRRPLNEVGRHSDTPSSTAPSAAPIAAST